MDGGLGYRSGAVGPWVQHSIIDFRPPEHVKETYFRIQKLVPSMHGPVRRPEEAPAGAPEPPSERPSEPPDRLAPPEVQAPPAPKRRGRPPKADAEKAKARPKAATKRAPRAPPAAAAELRQQRGGGAVLAMQREERSFVPLWDVVRTRADAGAFGCLRRVTWGRNPPCTGASAASSRC